MTVNPLRGFKHFFHKIFMSQGARKIFLHLSSSKWHRWRMCPPNLSSLKWGEDGELSPNDTLELVERLSRTEQTMNLPDKKKLNLSPLKNSNEENTASWLILTRKTRQPQLFGLLSITSHIYLRLTFDNFTILDLVPAPKELHETNSAVRRAWHHVYRMRSCSDVARPSNHCCSWARPSFFLLLNPGTYEQSSVKRPDLTSTSHSFELMHQV